MNERLASGISELAEPRREPDEAMPVLPQWIHSRVRIKGSNEEFDVNYKHVLQNLGRSCARGVFYGAGTGIFLFLRLGLPGNAQLAGYISGLFLVAGLEFGFTVGLLQVAYRGYMRKGERCQEPNSNSNVTGRSPTEANSASNLPV